MSTVLRRLRPTLLLGLSLWHLQTVAAEPVRIGVILPLSNTIVGVEQSNGVALAIEEFQRAHIEPKFEVYAADSQCKPDVALAKAHQYFDQERIELIIGGGCGADPALSKEVTERGKVYLSVSSLPDAAAGARDKSPTNAFFLGPPRLKATQFAAELTKQTQQRVSAGRFCLSTFLPEKEEFSDSVAAICPVLYVDKPRWDRFRSAYFNKYRTEPSAPAAIGYVAGQIATQSYEHQRSASEVLRGLRERSFDTLLGSVKPAAENPLGTKLVAVGKPGIDSRARQSISAAAKKTCDACVKGGECPQGQLADLMFAPAKEECCKKSGECPQGSLVLFR